MMFWFLNLCTLGGGNDGRILDRESGESEKRALVDLIFLLHLDCAFMGADFFYNRAAGIFSYSPDSRDSRSLSDLRILTANEREWTPIEDKSFGFLDLKTCLPWRLGGEEMRSLGMPERL